jgi:lipopolysaccharide transport system ATP-binding protein
VIEDRIDSGRTTIIGSSDRKMGEIAIKAEGLSKRYWLGALERENALRNVLGPILRAPWKLLKREKKEMFWALKGVDLEVKQGEVLGLIGRNGAGKTTLLKILSRITRPTEGWAEIYGRVGSLLEVGTGFHPELSGRDNTFLSGGILGMSKREIERKFDEIVAFAEIEKFIDTQVKHYSSGMYVRLAFAVAAHLEPEILLVDEVLAVGDIAFQKKCLGKMGDVAREGRTVILVSHNMAAINALCSRCVILSTGGVEFDGPTDTATTRYYAESLNMTTGSDLSGRPRAGSGKARFTSIYVQAVDQVGHSLDIACPGCDLNIDVELKCESNFAHANLAVIFYDSSGYRLIDTNTAQKGDFVSLQAGQTAKVNFLVRQVLLRPGKYFIELWLGREGVEVIDHIEHGTTLDVADGDETRGYSMLYPGTYLCRFDENISVLEASLDESPRPR